MADTYFDEENNEKAYILYLKYLTLFIEKVKNMTMNFKLLIKEFVIFF